MADTDITYIADRGRQDAIKGVVDKIYDEVTTDKTSGLVSRINIAVKAATIEITPYPVVGSTVTVTSTALVNGETWSQSQEVTNVDAKLRFDVPGKYEYSIVQTYQGNTIGTASASVSDQEFKQITLNGATIKVTAYQPITGTVITGTGGGQNYRWVMDDTTQTPTFYVPGGVSYTFTQTNGSTKIGEVTVAVTNGENAAVTINAAKLTITLYEAAVGTVLSVTGGGETQNKTVTSASETPVFYVPGGYEYTITQIFSGDITGTATVSVATGEAKNVVMGPYFTDVASATWDMIKNVVNKGQASKFIKAGDKKTVTLSTGEQVTFVVAGVNTYDGAVDFIAENCLKDTRQMNSSNTNQNGFGGSAMKTWLNGTFFGQLPSDLQNVISAKTVKTAQNGNSGSLNQTDCKIWLPTGYELFGSTTHYARSEEDAVQKQYPIFTSDSSRIKKQGANGSACSWWTASPYSGNTDYFVFVRADGAAGYASNTYGVAPGFRILRES